MTSRRQEARKQQGLRTGTKIGFVIAAVIIGTITFTAWSFRPIGVQGGHSEPVLIHDHVVIEGVPAGVGILPELWNNHDLDSLGANHFAPIHTHDRTGLVHIESKEIKEFSLGYVLSIWGVNARSACLVPEDDAFSCTPIADIDGHILKDGEHIRLDLE